MRKIHADIVIATPLAINQPKTTSRVVVARGSAAQVDHRSQLLLALECGGGYSGTLKRDRDTPVEVRRCEFDRVSRHDPGCGNYCSVDRLSDPRPDHNTTIPCLQSISKGKNRRRVPQVALVEQARCTVANAWRLPSRRTASERRKRRGGMDVAVIGDRLHPVSMIALGLTQFRRVLTPRPRILTPRE